VYSVVDVIQIPAFLCRQTDLIQAACATGKIVNIKKGQFLAPWDVAGILSKCADAKEVWITERGTSFGYNTLVVDFTGLDYMLTNYNVPIVLDATHSVQKPGGLGSSSGGNRAYVPGLARAASALGVSNFFLEVHPGPDNAPSDGPNMLHLKDFEKVAADISAISKLVTENKNVKMY
jgi:2-dehydro-3-deoxyphosphooctonate aldolase (KDO 8-P synthase)